MPTPRFEATQRYAYIPRSCTCPQLLLSFFVFVLLPRRRLREDVEALSQCLDDHEKYSITVTRVSLNVYRGKTARCRYTCCTQDLCATLQVQIRKSNLLL